MGRPKGSKNKRIPILEGFERCCVCKESKPISDFHGTTPPNWAGKTWSKQCKKCAWERGLEHKYGILPQDYEWMLQQQHGRCLICGKPPEKGKKLVVDHCHERGNVRGLLCTHCNIGLGSFKDDLERIWMAYIYLYRHKQRALIPIANCPVCNKHIYSVFLVDDPDYIPLPMRVCMCRHKDSKRRKNSTPFAKRLGKEAERTNPISLIDFSINACYAPNI